MALDKQILTILADVGYKGIGVRQLSMHVYNLNCTLFSQPDFFEIYSYVKSYLLRNSKNDSSLIERTERRGYYRLNTRNNADACRLMLEFSNQSTLSDKEEKTEETQTDLSLSLFD